MALTDKLKAIGNAIRAKTGGTEELTLDQMVTEIDGISTGGGSNEEWIGDGNTHIWISLTEGRTSPMLGCCPNGTVTVDWGDGTEPDTLTGTSTDSVMWTPTHEYAAPGDYIVTLTVDGEMGFYGSGSDNQYSGVLRYASSADTRNRTYANAVQKVEIGKSVTYIGGHAFSCCRSLSSITIPESVTYIGDYALYNCSYLSSITIPESVTYIGRSAFSGCSSLSSVTITEGVTSIGSSTFFSCPSLSSITIPESVTSIDSEAFYSCSSLSSITIPESVTSIGSSAFRYCFGMRYYDFTACTSVPTLSGTNAFANIPADCQMLIPAALYDEWSAATNWATYASYMVAV